MGLVPRNRNRGNLVQYAKKVKYPNSDIDFTERPTQCCCVAVTVRFHTVDYECFGDPEFWVGRDQI